MEKADSRVFAEVQHGTEAYLETVTLRDQLLRRPLGLRFSAKALAEEKDSFHLTCRQNNCLAACLILKPLPNRELHMRQLAVVESLQHQGIGTQLVQYAETFARERRCLRIRLHARETAVGFYERLGYTKEGDRFIEVTIPHFRMSKTFREKVSQ